MPGNRYQAFLFHALKHYVDDKIECAPEFPRLLIETEDCLELPAHSPTHPPAIDSSGLEWV